MFTSLMAESALNSGISSCLFDFAEKRLKERKIRAALELYHRAEASGFSPDQCAGARWICHMLLGDFVSAWHESDAIEARGNQDPHRFWDGRPFTGRKVLIRCLHGLGDTIQYLRYVPRIRDVADSVTIEAQPALKDLLSAAAIADEVITWGDPEPAWDQQVEIVELPRIFRSTQDNLPQQTPYLAVPVGGRKFSGDGPRVGLVWASGSFDVSRCIPFELFSSLTALRGVSFHSLQTDPERQDLLRSNAPIADCLEESLLSTAQTVRNFDLVITVDTLMAHLAGALGVRVWTLLPFASDWRWMMGRTDSPWYPGMRLFRQTSPGDWSPVIQQVAQELGRWATDREA